MRNPDVPEGILLVNKPKNKTSFSLVHFLRKKTKVQKIGHTGTLDPFATGLMILLVGKSFTKLSDQFLTHDKEYIATLQLGIETDSYDCDGKVISTSSYIPTELEIDKALLYFQGEVEQVPPMFSAKKINGKKLYLLARQGKTIERKKEKVFLKTEKLSYSYPFLRLKIFCSKGTYIRSIAQELGNQLTSKAHLIELQRTKCGPYELQEAIDGNFLFSEEPIDFPSYLQKNMKI